MCASAHYRMTCERPKEGRLTTLCKRWFMNEKEQLLEDTLGAVQPKEESRLKKYIRLAFVSVGMTLFLAFIVMAALRRYGG